MRDTGGRRSPRRSWPGRQPVAGLLLPSPPRSAPICAKRFAAVMPEPLKKVFLLTTGSEAVEYAIKVARTHGQMAGGRQKNVIVSLREGVPRPDAGLAAGGRHPCVERLDREPGPGLHPVAVPGRLLDAGHELSSSSRRRWPNAGVAAAAGLRRDHGDLSGRHGCLRAARVHQDAAASGATRHKAVLVFDEVQAGFGRTGTDVGL